MGAVAGGEDFAALAGEETLSLVTLTAGDEGSSLQEQSDCSQTAISGTDVEDSGVVSPEETTKGELRDMALDRKSV